VCVCVCVYGRRTLVRSRNAYQRLHLGLSVASEPLFVHEVECIFVTSMYIAVRLPDKIRVIINSMERNYLLRRIAFSQKLNSINGDNVS